MHLLWKLANFTSVPVQCLAYFMYKNVSLAYRIDIFSAGIQQENGSIVVKFGIFHQKMQKSSKITVFKKEIKLLY